MSILPLFLYLFGFSIALGAALVAALSDVRQFRIPNFISVLVVMGFVLAYMGMLLLPSDEVLVFGPLKYHLLSGAIMFLLTFGLFAGGVLGAGDAKFASTLALWCGLKTLLIFIFYLSLFGGVLGLITLILARLKPFKNPHPGGWVAMSQMGQRRVPYGVAITAGFILVMLADHRFDIMAIINLGEKM
jgi:prepilin peptidase CpaA